MVCLLHYITHTSSNKEEWNINEPELNIPLRSQHWFIHANEFPGKWINYSPFYVCIWANLLTCFLAKFSSIIQLFYLTSCGLKYIVRRTHTDFIWYKLCYLFNTTTLMMTKFYKSKFDLWPVSMTLTLYFQWPLNLTYSTWKKDKVCILYNLIGMAKNNAAKRLTERQNELDLKQCISKSSIIWEIITQKQPSPTLPYLHVFQSFSINYIPRVTSQIHSDEPEKKYMKIQITFIWFKKSKLFNIVKNLLQYM